MEKILKVPHFHQAKGSLDCGIICLRMALPYYGKNYSYKELRRKLKIQESG